MEDIKIKHNIKYISIIIYTKDLSNQIMILVGKEFNNKPNKTDVGLYSDLYGQLDKDETIPNAVSRILFENTMNMVMDQFKFKKLISDNKIKYKINNNWITFLYKVDYNQHMYLPDYYNKVFEYMNLCRNTTSMRFWLVESCPFNFFNKSELKWINYNFIANNLSIFKPLFIENLFANLS